MATYAIGDVQGCYDELQLLLQKIQFDPEKDQLWFVGDLVGRGPKSLEVLRYIMGTVPEGDCPQFSRERHSVPIRGLSPIITLGNHDLHLLAVAAGVQKENPEDHFSEILNAPDKDDLLNWLRHQKILHYNKKLDFLMIHAGLYPQWNLVEAQGYAKELEQALQSDQYQEILKNMYGNESLVWKKNLKGPERFRFLINAFTRMRFCTKNGELNLTEKNSIGQQPKNLIPWFELAKIPCNLIFGHWAALNGKTNQPNLFALDTGCVWGHELTALRLEDQRRLSVTKLKS